MLNRRRWRAVCVRNVRFQTASSRHNRRNDFLYYYMRSQKHPNGDRTENLLFPATPCISFFSLSFSLRDILMPFPLVFPQAPANINRQQKETIQLYTLVNYKQVSRTLQSGRTKDRLFSQGQKWYGCCF